MESIDLTDEITRLYAGLIKASTAKSKTKCRKAIDSLAVDLKSIEFALASGKDIIANGHEVKPEDLRRMIETVENAQC